MRKSKVDFRSGTPIGYVSKPFGFKGQIKLQLNDDSYKDLINEKEFLFLKIDGKGVPFFVEECNTGKDVVLLEDIHSEEEAQALSSLTLLDMEGRVQSDELDLLGYQVLNPVGQLLGEVVGKENFNGNEVLVLNLENQEFFVPFHNDLLLKLDHDLGAITLDYSPIKE